MITPPIHAWGEKAGPSHSPAAITKAATGPIAKARLVFKCPGNKACKIFQGGESRCSIFFRESSAAIEQENKAAEDAMRYSALYWYAENDHIDLDFCPCGSFYRLV
jgi:hypothetical protein